jgi:hypothetical protein
VRRSYPWSRRAPCGCRLPTRRQLRSHHRRGWCGRPCRRSAAAGAGRSPRADRCTWLAAAGWPPPASGRGRPARPGGAARRRRRLPVRPGGAPRPARPVWPGGLHADRLAGRRAGRQRPRRAGPAAGRPGACPRPRLGRWRRPRGRAADYRRGRDLGAGPYRCQRGCGGDLQGIVRVRAAAGLPGPGAGARRALAGISGRALPRPAPPPT